MVRSTKYLWGLGEIMKKIVIDCIAWLSVLAVWIISFFGLGFFLKDWIKKDSLALSIIFAFSLIISLGYTYIVDYIEDKLKKRSWKNES